MNDILTKINESVGGLTSLVMNLLALGILVEVIYGAGIFGMGIVGNVVGIVISVVFGLIYKGKLRLIKSPFVTGGDWICGVKLLKGSVKLNEGGTVDVVGADGQVRYDDKGQPIKVTTLVKEFLTANPHFVNSGPSGTGTGQGTGKQENVVENDITKLNMNNPADREQYRKIMLGRGIRV